MTKGIPQMETTIKKDFSGLFAVVTVTYQEGRKAITTMRANIKPSDIEVINFKRKLLHLQELNA